MKFVFECKGRNDELQISAIRADLEYTKWRIMRGINDTMKRIRNDKNMAFRIARLLMRLGRRIGIDEFIRLLEEASSSVSIYNYKLDKTEDGIRLEVDVEDLYFEIVESIPVAGFIEKVFRSRKQFAGQIVKSLAGEYGYSAIASQGGN